MKLNDIREFTKIKQKRKKMEEASMAKMIVVDWVTSIGNSL